VKPYSHMRIAKKDREKSILIGLIDMFIKTNKPVGSNTLKLQGFEHLSSATIRNYFNKLEKTGLLKQHHSSGGRVPTAKAYREYANYYMDKAAITSKEEAALTSKLKRTTKEIASYLNLSADTISEITNCGCFLLLPCFDQDYINTIRLVSIESKKILCIIITDFGLIKTESLNIPRELSDKQVKLIEDFFMWSMGKGEKPHLDEGYLLKLSQHLYNEIIMRHIVGSNNNFDNKDDIYKTGLSKLLTYPEFNNPGTLADSLSLFESYDQMNVLLQETMKINRLTSWIGDELIAFSSNATNCSIISCPYHINTMPVGAVALLGPMRLNYKKIFGMTQAFCRSISDTLTKSVYKYKLSFRQNTNEKANDRNYIKKSKRLILLEDKSIDQ
jgi:heat-inducible transcriptional repressor